jgi:hypothetical protein
MENRIADMPVGIRTQQLASTKPVVAAMPTSIAHKFYSLFLVYFFMRYFGSGN